MALVGRTVLLPRRRDPDALAQGLAEAGARVLRVALTRTVTGPRQEQGLARLSEDLVAGGAAWLVLTSARSVEALAPHLRRAQRARGAGAAPGDAAERRCAHAPGSPTTSAPTGTGAPGPAGRTSPPHHPSNPSGPGAAPGPTGTPPLGGPAAAVRVAVVGPATARAWEEATGLTPDLVARGSAAALLDLPDLAGGPRPPAASLGESGADSADGAAGASGSAPGPGAPPSRTAPDALAPAEAQRRLLLPASALADPALAQGLRRSGWEVEQVEAYTTRALEPGEVPEELRRAWRPRGGDSGPDGSPDDGTGSGCAGGVDAVVLTAPSTARAMVELLGHPPRATRLVAIGATTARAIRGLGLEVAAVASAPTPAGVREAVEEALREP
ncbi:uroporphyrinogen-III synthase [Actinomyces bowdenii]|uniref:uroporphyrinogen-III synthase n=1 Tax=Actinomyces bowdenii TaxID=131109 RepID=UPI00214CCAC4|nr:uroporphyrinogen-III synthase [Actinomyces bowdenii]MCR2051286.1 uroporphyrinogen-III synthase [Actinomyces bowdenii]